MIFDESAQLVVGNLGWVDKGSLWTFDLHSQTEQWIPVADAKYLGLRAGVNGLFRLACEHSVSIRHVREPGVELASVQFGQGEASFVGDPDLWEQVETAVAGEPVRLIDARNRRVIDLDSTWFTQGPYDLGYQTIVDAVNIKSIGRVIVAVQRSSALVVIDPDLNRQVGSIVLAGRHGNPQLRMRTETDFLASDYDTLCRIDIDSLGVSKTARLQDAASERAQQFIGDYQIGPSGCAVARPFSGDVLLVDPNDLRVLARAPVEGQPLQICMVSESRVVTRDWQTGRVAIGEFLPV